MAFTGDLEHLHIVDIIQLIQATKKSGVFFVTGSKGESTIVFKSGYIISANHINNSVRIGAVLVKMGAVTMDDLKQAMSVVKNADKNHLPLLAALVKAGTLNQDDALRGLKKLVVMTIVELMSWTKGTFTFDTETMLGSANGEQELEIDVQMVLMDALRIFDERERDRKEGKEVPSFEAQYADVVLPEERAEETKEERPTVTADDLGLGDLDRLEKKIPRPVAEMEIFNPAAIQRQKIKELLTGFSLEEQEAFVSYLRKSVDRKPAPDAAAQAGKAVIMFSGDTLISHSVMSLCNDEGVLVFATRDEKELYRMISQCLLASRMPVIVIDDPAKSEGGFSRESSEGLRKQVRGKYPAVPVVQFASPQDADFILQSYQSGVTAVFPKPSKDGRKETYIQDTIKFLGAFMSYIKGFQSRLADTDADLKKLKDSIARLHRIKLPSDAAFEVLTVVSGMFERAATLVVRGPELIGERAIGVGSEKSIGPAPADRLKIQLSKPSVFRDVIEKGRVYYGESGDETLRKFFSEIGKPLSPAILLLPLISERKVVAVIYGDFGQQEASPIRLDMLEILALQAGIVLEYAMFRRQSTKAPQQS